MTPFISSPVTNKKPAGASILRRACLETGIPLPGLVTSGTAAKVEMKAWQADVRTTTAAVAGAMTGVVTTTMTGTRTATVPHGAPGIDGFTAVVAARIHALAIHGRPAGGAGVRVAAAGGVMLITRLHSGRSEDSKAGRDGQEGDELVHCELGLIRCRQMAAYLNRRNPVGTIQQQPIF